MATTLRVPQIDLATLLTQQNPRIDLRLQAYEISTRTFLKAVSSYKNRAITIINERRNAQATEIKRVAEKAHAVETETNQCKVKEIQLLADLEREQEERKESELSVATLKRQLVALREKCASIDIDIEHYRALTANLRREKDKDRSILQTHAAEIVPQLQCCERYLACVIEGIERDQVLVRFTSIDKSDLRREFSFVIDVSSRVYRVLTSTPRLPTLPILVDALNDSRDFYSFIRQVRHAYVEMARQK